MHNTPKVLIQLGWFVLTVNVWGCRHTSEPPKQEDMLAGKAFFTGPTPVSQHYGIQVIAYLKSDTVLAPVDTTFTDGTGFYSFGKPSVGGLYMLTAYYPFYYRDTVTVEFQGSRREGEIRDMYIRQKVRVKFTSDKSVYQFSDLFTWSVDVMNVSKDTLLLPNMSWFDYSRWNILMFISTQNDSLRFGYHVGAIPGHFPPCETYEPGKAMVLTKSVYVGYFTDINGKQIAPGRYLFYALNKGCLHLEKNGRIVPFIEPAEVEITP